MQVQYRETKGGFECIHVPSIDLTSIETNKGNHQLQASSISGETSPITTVNSRPSIVKKASKISFTLKRDKGKEKDHSIENNKDKDREVAGRPSGATTLTATPSSGSSSFINVSSNHTVVPSSDKETTLNGVVSPSSNDVDATSPRSPSPVTATAAIVASNKGKVLPPIPRDFASPRPVSPLPAHRSPSPLPTGEVDRDVFESMGNNSLSVRFEINIVKVM